MIKKLLYFFALSALAVLIASILKIAPPAAAHGPTAAQHSFESQEHVVVALGRVEPQSEEVRIGAEITGKLARVAVREGQRVHRGELLAVLENSDLKAQLLAAEATVNERDAELSRIINGARSEERAEAWSAVTEADATLENLRGEAQRRIDLLAKDEISREEYERADRSFRVAAARSEGAHHHFELVNSPARDEDKARAEASLRWARTQVAEAVARLQKTEIRSPMTAVVLKQHLKTGENVSPSPEMPIFTLGDTSRLRVRADVDESDIAKIRLGQPARVKADAFHDQFFTGHVVKISQSLGKKNVRSDRAAERFDRDILEVLIELDDNSMLRSGLRVDVFLTNLGHR